MSIGWTNTVKEIVYENKEYIVRFPKTEFFSKQIEKDVFVSNFLNQELNIPTSKMKLMCDNGRFYSMHEKIKGCSLNEVLPLNKKDMSNLAIEIARYFYKLHSYNIEKLPIKLKGRYYDFLSNLPKLSNYDYSIFNGMLQDEMEEKQVLINGDLTTKNIIVDENNQINAFIDFSFCGICDIYTDLSVIGCICIDEDFFYKILEEYEKISGKKLKMHKIQDRLKMRNYINEQYVRYMIENHREVSL
jgi:aminoglycoside phosphotransferase (APT) family kinase protein